MLCQKDKYLLCEGILLLAYAYVPSYPRASVMLGFLAAFLSIDFHSVNLLVDNLEKIFVYSVIQFAVLCLCRPEGILGVTAFLAVCNTVFSVLWVKSSYKTIRGIMGFVLVAYLITMIIVRFLPKDMLGMMLGTETTMIQAVVFISMIFVPQLYFYALRFLPRLMKLQRKYRITLSLEKRVPRHVIQKS